MARRNIVQCVCCGKCYTSNGKPTKSPSFDDLMTYGCYECGLGNAKNKSEIGQLKGLRLSETLLGYLNPKKWVKND